MEYHKYSAVPIISRTGRYIGTITEGDMLWGIKNKFNLSLKEAERVTVAAIDRRLDNRPVFANSNMEDLIDKALNQFPWWTTRRILLESLPERTSFVITMISHRNAVRRRRQAGTLEIRRVWCLDKYDGDQAL